MVLTPLIYSIAPTVKAYSLAVADPFGIETAANQAGIKAIPAVAKKEPPQVVADVLGIALTFLGIIFFALMIYAGVTWMVAMGDSSRVDTAKQTLEAAIIGLLIVLAAYAITSFVFNRLAGVSTGTPSQSNQQEYSCTNKKNGDKCGPSTSINMVCSSGSCVSKCEAKYTVTGKCHDLSGGKKCPSGETLETNLCPSPANNNYFRCCYNKNLEPTKKP